MKSEEIWGWEEGMGGKRKFATSFSNLKNEFSIHIYSHNSGLNQDFKV